MSAIELQSVCKSLGEKPVVRDVSLSIAKGEFVAILGPSGCGKTTMLRLIAGFETVDSGRVLVGGRALSAPGTHAPPEVRNVGIVFQNYALWPHMSVAENVGFSLKVAGLPRAEREARVSRTLAMVGLTQFGDRAPAALSGGQRQRVALARCLAAKNPVVLLDEPLANLDVHLRAAMEDEFADFHVRSAATMLYVTHDQAEAMALADRIAVMDAGRIVQFDTPQTLYREPANEMIARFVGDGRLVAVEDLRPLGDGRATARLYGQPVTVRCAAGERPRPHASLSLHPGDLSLTGDDPQAGLAAEVLRVRYRGDHFRAELALGADSQIVLPVNLPQRVPVGQKVAVALRDGWVLPDPNLAQAQAA